MSQSGDDGKAQTSAEDRLMNGSGGARHPNGENNPEAMAGDQGRIGHEACRRRLVGWALNLDGDDLHSTSPASCDHGRN